MILKTKFSLIHYFIGVNIFILIIYKLYCVLYIKEKYQGSDLTLEEHIIIRRKKENINQYEMGFDKASIEKNEKFEDETLSTLYDFYKSDSVRSQRAPNQFQVQYNGPKLKYLPSPKELICDAINNVKPQVYQRGNDEFFTKINKDQYFPKEVFLENELYKNCAIIMNAGAILGSKNGKFIDDHEFVLRFNNGPTEGYEEDVGSKTSLRLINSLIVRYPFYKFMNRSNTFYTKNMALTFELSLYSHTSEFWFMQQSKSFFNNYFKRRKMNPEAKLYLMKSKFIWNIWDWLSSKFELPLLQRIPSSGFIGLFTVLSHCQKIRLFEYIPSKRKNAQCHYFSRSKYNNCSYMGGHPISAEKLITYIMSNTGRNEIFSKGYITIDTNHCRSAKA